MSLVSLVHPERKAPLAATIATPHTAASGRLGTNARALAKLVFDVNMALPVLTIASAHVGGKVVGQVKVCGRVPSVSAVCQGS